MDILIITGMSGAGKSSALNVMEDMGFYSMDNVPPTLLPKFTELCMAAGNNINQVALVLDIRAVGFFKDISPVIKELKAMGNNVKILFLEASDQVLIKRYKEFRRPHPLTPNDTISAGIKKEREMLKVLREESDYIIDTSRLKNQDLKIEIKELLMGKDASKLFCSIVSFGFKNGILLDGDLIFDVRFLPNPYHIAELRDKNGLNEETKEYVMKWDQTKEFIEKALDMIEFLVPHYTNEGRSQLVIGIGCTGGFHRSVAISEYLGKKLEEKGIRSAVSHRDKDR
ncbi:MAG: RNase adapter RapZ [Tissierellia bacterium]|nr:RNase adapter RapZ [Tissierellia bacterium]